jgi:hypothetical protein
MLGATWTDGNAPDDSSQKGNMMGTSQLANSTIETFTQRTNCFNCHNNKSTGRPKPVGPNDGPTPVTTGVSHVFHTLHKLRFK